MILRQFLYLDEPMMETFLAQLEGGIYDEEQSRLRREETRNRGAGLSAGPAKVEITRGRAEHEEIARSVKQTPASKFDRLYRLASDQRNVQDLVACDEVIWDQLEHGELLNVEIQLTLPWLTKVFDLASRLRPLVGLSLPAEIQKSFDPQGAAAIAAIDQLGQLLTAGIVECVAHIPACPEFRFKFRLKQEALMVPQGELEGEATILAKLHRKLADGDRLASCDLVPGIEAIGPEQRRQYEEALADGSTEFGFNQFWLTPPAAVLTPVAIYR